jgi:hypothetical protein
MYVLCEIFDYEGEAVLGLYSSEQEARSAASDYQSSRVDSQGRCDVDGLCIYELQVGAAPRLRADADMYI